MKKHQKRKSEMKEMNEKEYMKEIESKFFECVKAQTLRGDSQ